MAQVIATYSVKKWARKAWGDQPAAEVTGAKLFRIEMSHIYTGHIEGEAAVQYLVTQNEAGKGNFVALEKVTGRVGGRSGSFVLQRIGAFDNGKVKQTLVVMPGSGTGDLSGLSGQATFEGDQHQESYPITFHYEV